MLMAQQHAHAVALPYLDQTMKCHCMCGAGYRFIRFLRTSRSYTRMILSCDPATNPPSGASLTTPGGMAINDTIQCSASWIVSVDCRKDTSNHQRRLAARSCAFVAYPGAHSSRTADRHWKELPTRHGAI